ncbi:SGNH/GDSL hydrolase family protein [Exiguobacterium sp.]|uniref:SGNH/GDSL hydrolase family protein n=1 Tax=Exiguobacterium sp. TaxID=44751 RepID=UPI000E90C14C|nr:SGNH/GDSL hydrolase family protein [Exiguobacterium sp.]HBF59706.1 hypothetical protein [Exiguobacterium sp.]
METKHYGFPKIDGTASVKIPRDFNLLADSVDRILKSQLTSLLDQVSSLSSGSPKGVYNTLLDLQNAKPQGDANTYVISSSGEWYFWNGTTWLSGGIYQAPLLGDGAITNKKLAQEIVSPDKTTFFKPFSNMFDKTKISQGFDILSSTGELVANPSYFASDFIPVVPGRVYKLKNFGGGEEYTNFGFYTQEKTFVRRIQEHLPFTIPEGVYFIRFSTVENKDVITFSLNSVVPTSYISYGKTSLDLEFLKDVTGEQIKNETITPEKTVFFGESYNLFNPSTAFAGFDLSASTGQLMAAEGYFSSDYIAISPNAVYKLKNFLSQNEYSSFAFYTQNKTFIQRIQEWRTFTAPSNAYYMRFASTENKNGITVSLASNIPVQYVPYDTRKIKPDLLPLIADNRFKALKWNSLGDSITEANKYQTFVNQKLDFNMVRNYGIGGTCLAVKADESNLTTAFVRRYTAMDNDADVITVMGGTNDFGLNIPLGNEDVKDEKTVLGAMAIIIEGLIAKYPGKYIIWATLPQRNNGFETDGKNANGETTADFAEGIKRTCRKYAIPCIDIHNESGINKFNMNENGSLMPDRVHPSDTGHKRLAALFINMFDKVVF